MRNIFFAIAAMGIAASLPTYGQQMRMLTGSPVPSAPNQRVIVLNADTRWVNVSQGEEVKFVAGGTEFSWKFDGPGARPFDLQLLAPAGAVSRPITVYIAPSAGHPAR